MTSRDECPQIPDVERRTGDAQPAKGLDASGLERSLLELVKVRASQINGCAYCLDMHTNDARAKGETEQRLDALNGWRETPVFSDRERAALEWAQAITRVADTHVPDDVYDPLRLRDGKLQRAQMFYFDTPAVAGFLTRSSAYISRIFA